MNNFTKEYIKECDCGEIQGLRKSFGIDDCFISKNKEIWGTDKWYRGLLTVGARKNYIWLPTGDQLDEEIVRVCEKEKRIYCFRYYPTKSGFINSVAGKYEIHINPDRFISVEPDTNPLIAKIKLLKELLK